MSHAFQFMQEALECQKSAYLVNPEPSYESRIDDLRTLERFVREQQEAMIAAIDRDYGHRSRHETLFTEIMPTLDGIKHAIKHLKQWMRPQRRSVDFMTFTGARNRVIPQPLGVVGVIVPWNFPVFLTFSPLTSIFAAGNRAMVKMSENSRHLAALLNEKIPLYFPAEKLQFFDEQGGIGIEFSKLPFDHLLFTGSSQTGRAVMAAAAQNLCPVTLELGGKSPAVVLDDFPLHKAAARIMYVKLLNAGQICTTVDYAYLPEHKINEFVQLARNIVVQRYSSIHSVDYSSIIDDKSFMRLTQALTDAQSKGSTLIQLIDGEPWDARTRKIAPHIVLNAPDDCELMQREIFGPVLPIKGFEDVHAVVQAINARPRPLAFYPFSNDAPQVHNLLRRVMSGGVTVNDALLHVAQHDLPFGGVGASGMGHYHGHEGFVTFSKMRPVFYQTAMSSLMFMMPPYGKRFERILKFLMR
ncbi:Coniferyl aldehyde dehydrogenase [Ephemeroptericola cinctiostellae]|uniref:Aldehyde dehydrogenase n=1 Tax=Ephemeroptericola cinctiostellae TaxID=2268024 RepID=A0A345DBZ6_9BURK|nr:coniferyl aldehyde dehydrogenase [Ephemeroptericola cinctiostellae]AXF85884.1 Coniferyl aldehyde dehydrogenase [Ephemeroptericola cinctiostellae]